MSGQTRQDHEYTVPSGDLGLKGPVAKPAPGTLPLRGDLAHIALAGTHLAAHYVIPQVWTVGEKGVDVMETIRDDSPVVAHFEAGTKVEVIDVSGDWIWGCLGPEGPSGYMKASALSAG
ncbi:hypothetical protein INR77_05510 [Erythrobacter sp. SCSIO 43205]|uniref:hypothetical protein n=1 Tax=Erythrobacter sp. SCSIO 43205 TaxID=2779361 RepID=UPI001CAA2A14|nr:hypothetical protein [Erythrobacter sp. SCSIO 43205]UAB79142.1 hypothetical protein INR77_05510 [Erythrobacter sp. SCSIO 43205]